MFSRWPGGRSRKSSFVCHLIRDTEMDTFWRTRIVTQFHLFPLICTCTLSAGQAERDFWLRSSPGGRATLPSAAATGTHPFCPTYLSNPGFMALSTSLSKRFHSVQYSSSRSTERRFTTIISARFLCAWQRIYLYLFRKYICSGKPPSPQKHMVYICNPAPRCSNPPGPSRKTSSPRPWQPYSLSQDPWLLVAL